MTTTDPVAPGHPADPQADWRHLPPPVRRDELVETSAVSWPPGPADLAGDQEAEFRVRLGG
jgi:hypothetical protein